jgi:hypothetical protein
MANRQGGTNQHLEILMKKLIIAMIVPLALVASGCDRKAPDGTNPKTSAAQPAAPTQMSRNSSTPSDSSSPSSDQQSKN